MPRILVDRQVAADYADAVVAAWASRDGFLDAVEAVGSSALTSLAAAAREAIVAGAGRDAMQAVMDAVVGSAFLARLRLPLDRMLDAGRHLQIADARMREVGGRGMRKGARPEPDPLIGSPRELRPRGPLTHPR